MTAPQQPADEIQIGGSHYKKMEIQPWTAMEDWMSHEEFRGYLWGNAIKYIARWKEKGGFVDLDKAVHYIQKLKEIEEAQHVKNN